MKPIAKFATTVLAVLASAFVLTIGFIAYLVFTSETVIYSKEIDENRTLKIYGILDDGPGPFADIYLEVNGERTDGLGVVFTLKQQSQLDGKIEEISHSNQIYEFSYTDDYRRYLFEVDLIENSLRTKSSEKI